MSYLRQRLNMLIKVHRTRYVSWYRKQYLKHVCWPNTVLIESTHGDQFYGHMYYVALALAKTHPELELHIAMRANQIAHVQASLHAVGVDKIKVIPYLGKEYAKLLASAEYLYNDTSFYGFFIKQSFQKYFNIWHGTPLKYLGKDDGDIPNMGNVQKNFLSADALIVSNDYTREALIHSFNLAGVTSGKIVVAPSPRNSVLCDPDIRTTTRKKYGFESQEVLVYMPTWRGGVSNIMDRSNELIDYLYKIDSVLRDDQSLYVKLHPFQIKKASIDFSHFQHVFAFPTDTETYEFLSATDGLITDYSSIMYDYLNTCKPIVLFTYDKDEYYASRGCYEDVDNYPLTQARTISELTRWLQGSRDIDELALDTFKQRFISRDNPKGAYQVTAYTLGKENSPQIDSFSLRNNKDNVLIFAGSLRNNGMTTALFNTLESINTSSRNYIIFFNHDQVAPEDRWRLSDLPDGVQFYPVPSGKVANLFEQFALRRFLRSTHAWRKWFTRVTDQVYSREYQRLFGELGATTLIHFTGYERDYAEMICALKSSPVRTAIYVHNDMVKEAEEKGSELGLPILKRTYQMADKVVLVNEAMRKEFSNAFQICPEHIVVVQNFLGEKRVQQLAREPLSDSLASLIEPIAPNQDPHVYNEPLTRTRLDELKSALMNPQIKVFINIGRMTAQKGQDRLIKVFADLYPNHPSSRLVIVGSYGDQHDTLSRLISDSGCSSAIFLIGALSNPYPLLKAADALVFTSRYEALGLVVYEALAVGTDVITVSIPETTFLLQPGNAMVVPNTQVGLTEGWNNYLSQGFNPRPFNFEKAVTDSRLQFEALFS